MPMANGGATSRLNSSRLLLRKSRVSMSALSSASIAYGSMCPPGALPAQCDTTSRPRCVARWSSMPAPSRLHAESCVQGIRTWVVRFGHTGSATGIRRLDGDGDRLAASRRRAAGRSAIGVRALAAETVDAEAAAAHRDREIDARVIDHPFRGIGLDGPRPQASSEGNGARSIRVSVPDDRIPRCCL